MRSEGAEHCPRVTVLVLVEYWVSVSQWKAVNLTFYLYFV